MREGDRERLNKETSERNESLVSMNVFQCYWQLWSWLKVFPGCWTEIWIIHCLLNCWWISKVWQQAFAFVSNQYCLHFVFYECTGYVIYFIKFTFQGKEAHLWEANFNFRIPPFGSSLLCLLAPPKLKTFCSILIFHWAFNVILISEGYCQWFLQIIKGNECITVWAQWKHICPQSPCELPSLK